MTARDQERYAAAQHAIQSGIATQMTFNPNIQDPKHLRVGLNSALRDVGSLAMLLVKKGILTEDEVWEALADGMEEEKKLMEYLLSDHYKKKITLA